MPRYEQALQNHYKKMNAEWPWNETRIESAEAQMIQVLRHGGWSDPEDAEEDSSDPGEVDK